MKKLSTHIKGLDTLFHGGLQVTSVTDVNREQLAGENFEKNNSSCSTDKSSSNNQSVENKCTDKKTKQGDDNDPQRDSLVIIVRGCRGCHKHLFAMQLMHGLGISIYDYLKRRKNSATKDPESTTSNTTIYDFKGLRYYSINKLSHLLEDMYLDLLIERWISHTNIEYKEILLDLNNTEPKKDKFRKLNERNLNICKKLFEWESLNEKYPDDKSSIEVNLTYYLSNNIIGYNARTNSLHWRSGNGPDADNNLLVKRKEIDLETLLKELNKNAENSSTDNEERLQRNGKDGGRREYYEFKSEFLDASFKSELTHSSVRNASSARNNFYHILHEIEDIVESEDDAKDEDSKYQREVVVIEGFSHISEKDLQSIPYTHLLNCLRRISRISILVFEDSQTTIPDGDIELEIKSNFDNEEEYTYNEIRVAKSVNQVAASGWHLYKRQESHIRIYPSLHLRLFKRSYINNQMHEIGRSVFEDSYDRFWEIPVPVAIENETNKRASEIMSQSSLQSPEADNLLFQKASNFGNFSLNNIEKENTADTNNDAYKQLIRNCLLSRIPYSQTSLREWSYKVLSKVLSGKWWDENTYYPHDNKCFEIDERLIRTHNHPPVTTIVGNPNSFKRSLALCQAFAQKKQKPDGHVLIVLLDKDSDEMRKKIMCPGLFCELRKKLKADMGKCIDCYKKVTFLNVNPGCITPEELLSMIQDHIRVYVGKYDKFDKKRPLHIIFDDYHRIDFNFPFLSSSTLFTSALISLCQSYEVGLTILCDKNSRRVREVCTLSDYVLCVERHEKDVNRISIYMERMGDLPNPTSFLKYDISKLPLAMECGDKGLMLSKDFYKESITVSQIGSMKEYWRKTVNTVDTERPRHDDRKS